MKPFFCINICLLIAAVAFTISLTGCAGEAEPPAEKPAEPLYGGIYRRAFTDTFIVLDPAEVRDSFSHEVCRQLFDGLVELDGDGRVQPALAESWEISKDRLRYVFKLRKGARFHSSVGNPPRPSKNKGREFSAEDVLYTFRRLLDPEVKRQRGKLFWMIKGAKEFNLGEADELVGIEIIASDSIAFTLDKPFAPFLSILAMSNALIVPAEDAQCNDRPFSQEPVGTGPFVWGGKKGNTIVMKANENYFRGRPYLDQLEFPVIGDAMERFQAFIDGFLMHVDVPDQRYKYIKQSAKWKDLLQETSRWGTYYLGFNVELPPFDNPKVRQAINWAIDREAIVQIILNDRARVAKGVLPPGIMGYNPDLKGYYYNLERAASLMREAGYPDGDGFPEITLQLNTDATHSRTGELIIANLKDVGITCNIKVLDFQTHLESVENGQVGFFRMGWTVDYPDPDSFMYTLFHSSNFGERGNFSRYSNPLVDDLVQRARFEIDHELRVPLYQQAEQMVVNDAPWVFVYHYTTHLLAQPNVRGLKMTPMGSPFILYREIWLDSGKPD